MKVISFSLYGDSPKYCYGAVKNVCLARLHYPGWKCIFYHDSSVPRDIINHLAAEGSECRIAASPGRMFWRFIINDDPAVERYIVRDADSRLSEREATAVAHWEVSGSGFHIIRDHPSHNREIMGGLWGARRGTIPNMYSLISAWEPTDAYLNDQDYLSKVIWPMVRQNCLQHDSFHRGTFPGSVPFPSPRKDARFVGEVMEIALTGEDIPRASDLLKL